MEPAGLAIGVVGLAGQLFKASIECYDILSDTNDFATDHDNFVWQLNTERHRLIGWEKTWGLSSGLNQKLDPSDYRYRYVVGTLARIVSLLTSADSLSTKYGIQASEFDQAAAGNHPKGSGSNTALSATLPSLDVLGVQTLENPAILENEDLVSGLAQEIIRLKETTTRLQQVLPFYRKLRWAVVDKTRSGELIEQLRKYNDGLFAVLSDPRPALLQSTATTSRSFSKFNIPMQLPVQRNQNFRGRDDVLERMDRILNPGTKATNDTTDQVELASRHRIAVLYGLGGVGKSQVATEYAYRQYSGSAFTSVFWVDATSQASLAQSALRMAEQIASHYQTKWEDSNPDFVQIGAMLGLPGCIELTGRIKPDVGSPDLVIGAMKKWLSDTENRGWLVIFDNNDDIDSVTLLDFFPALDFGHGSIIITTRRFEVKALGVGVEMERIEKAAAISILLTSAGRTPKIMDGDDADYAEAAKIAERLAYLPLALDQAGGYISTKQLPLPSYLPLYTTNYQRVTSKSHRGLAERYRNDTIFTTWKISFDSLSQPASELLLLCAFLGNGDISEELLYRGRETIPHLFQDDELADDALEPLLSFSLAKRSTSVASLSFHPLVLEWARESLDAIGRRKHAKRAVSLVGVTYKVDSNGVRKAEDWTFGQRILAHIDISLHNIQTILCAGDIQDEETIRAIRGVGAYCIDNGRYSDAFEMLQKASISCQQGSSDEGLTPQTLKLMYTLARVYEQLGRYRETLDLCKKVSAIQEILLGKENADTLLTCKLMATQLNRLGRSKEALGLIKVVLSSQEKVLGMDHSDIQETAAEMAFILTRLGGSEEAIMLYKQVLASREKVLGKEHPDTLATAHNIAQTLDRMGQYGEALELNKQVLASREKVLGKEHPDTLTAAHNIAHTLGRMGQYGEAVELYKQVLASDEKVLGKEHPDTLTTAHNIAHTLGRMGQYGEAIMLYKQVLASREKVLGKEHPDTLTTAHNIAHTLGRMGQYGEAVELYKQVLASQEKVLGKEHPDTLLTASNMEYTLARWKGKKW